MMLTPERIIIRQVEAENRKLKDENKRLNEKLDGAREGVKELMQIFKPYVSVKLKLSIDRMMNDLD